MKLSVIIPCFNELSTIRAIVKKVMDTSYNEKEIIIVDDGSTDGTRDVLKSEIEPLVTKVIYHDRNMGKGMAVRSAIKHINGEITIIQDADLETDPIEHSRLVNPIKNGKELVVYGAREWSEAFRLSPVFVIGNTALTLVTNVLYNQKLTDMETCNKAFDTRLLKSISLNCRGFDFEPEITAKIAKCGIKIKEIPISYSPRKYSEGKKIRWVDGVIALWTLLKYRFVS